VILPYVNSPIIIEYEFYTFFDCGSVILIHDNIYDVDIKVAEDEIIGIFDFFRKKKQTVEEKNTDGETEYSQAYKLYLDKKYDEIISSFADDQEISLENKQIVALSYSQKGDTEKALELFEEIALKKDDVESWFNVMMTLMPLNKMEEAKEIFNKMLKMHKGLNDKQPRELGIPFIKYYYACGLVDAGFFSEALEHFDDLKKIYMSLKITDDTFVYIRGIPFLSMTLKWTEKAFIGLGMDFYSSDFLKELEKSVDKDGKRLIREYRAT